MISQWKFTRLGDGVIQVDCPTFAAPLTPSLYAGDRYVRGFYALAADLLDSQVDKAADLQGKPVDETPVLQASTDAQDAARYRWMRAAWLEGIEDDIDPVTQRAIGTVQDEAEMDEVIDAQIAAGNWPVRP